MTFSFVNIPQRGPVYPMLRRSRMNGPMREDVYKTKGQDPRWDGYLETLADHSQQPTGSPSMSTLPPSKS